MTFPPPSDPAVQVQQGLDQQNDHDEVGPQEEKVVDPSLGGHIDGKPQERWVSLRRGRWPYDEEERARQGLKLTAA